MMTPEKTPNERPRKAVRLACEICGMIGSHIPGDLEASEIELVGFIGKGPDNQSSPKWTCGHCVDGIMAINPDSMMVHFTAGEGDPADINSDDPWTGRLAE